MGDSKLVATPPSSHLASLRGNDELQVELPQLYADSAAAEDHSSGECFHQVNSLLVTLLYQLTTVQLPAARENISVRR